MIVALFTAFLFAGLQSQAQNKSYPFKPGEKLTYNMKFGWFNIGEAVLWLDPEFHYPNKKPHYKIQFTVTTASWFKVFSKLSFCMESLIEVNDLKPLRSDRDMEGRNKIDIRHDYFTYADSISIKAYIEDLDEWRYHRFPQGNVPIRDALSTYMWLRSRDRSQFSDEIEMRTFFTNDLYEFVMLPGKKTTHRYEDRKVGALEFGLVFPEGEFFDEGKTGLVILSDDRNRYPLRMEIDMTVGSFVFELDKVEYID
ncbi:Protein of unknown function [Ekhidna lutea]|uniref:DUF3108 domain-containing protein n=1 Tax=Ekhidna lutea TaxID=447679 RepID=A0A239FSF1_EKHLU|nr:Protein of unknown function [Ekhidna lutea]